jgi:hypothetical protein
VLLLKNNKDYSELFFSESVCFENLDMSREVKCASSFLSDLVTISHDPNLGSSVCSCLGGVFLVIVCVFAFFEGDS